MSYTYVSIATVNISSQQANYAWPEQLLLPERPPALIYLDLNHWINMAKFAGGRDGEDTKYRRLLDACRGATERGVVRFVLMDTLYQEIWKIKDPRQRTDISNLMEELTKFTSVLGRTTIMKLELQAAIEKIAGQSGQSGHYLPVSFLGHGVFHAFGMKGGISLKDREGNDVTDQARQRMGHERFEEFLRDSDLFTQRNMLSGPQDSEIEHLRNLGYKPELARKSAESRRDKEIDLSSRLTSDETNWRKGRLLDVIAASELSHELLEELNNQLEVTQVDLKTLIGENRSDARTFVQSMPSLHVAISMKMSYHRNQAKIWSVNDIVDIDAMSVAVAYCDVVYTDNAARNAIITAKLDLVMNTRIPRYPQELVDILDSL